MKQDCFVRDIHSPTGRSLFINELRFHFIAEAETYMEGLGYTKDEALEYIMLLPLLREEVARGKEKAQVHLSSRLWWQEQTD